MNKKTTSYLSLAVIAIFALIFIISLFTKDNKLETQEIKATVLSKNNETITVQDKDNIIYTFKTNNNTSEIGENIFIKYTGLLNKNTEIQEVSIINYETITVLNEDDTIPESWQDDGIFKNYYKLAYNKLKTLTLAEKIGQLFLVRYPDSNQIELLEKYKFSGYIFFEKDFTNKTKDQVINMMSSLQEKSNIPILTAVDEEGGKVVRVSSNSNLSSERFASPSELYNAGGFTLIKQDTIKKSNLLHSLGINLNLAPVVDVATNSSAYIYERTLKQGTELTSKYSSTVIGASKNTGVSYTLKHFPGYSNNEDTHTQTSSDNRTYEEILVNDIPPFTSGIEAGAEAILVNHNTVTSIDADNPASLSASVHNLLRNKLNFTGIIITDDLSMTALSSIDNVAVKAILAGNNLLITTNYETDISNVTAAVENGTISETTIDKLAFKILAWKYYKGLLFENQK